MNSTIFLGRLDTRRSKTVQCCLIVNLHSSSSFWIDPVTNACKKISVGMIHPRHSFSYQSEISSNQSWHFCQTLTFSACSLRRQRHLSVSLVSGSYSSYAAFVDETWASTTRRRPCKFSAKVLLCMLTLHTHFLPAHTWHIKDPNVRDMQGFKSWAPENNDLLLISGHFQLRIHQTWGWVNTSRSRPLLVRWHGTIWTVPLLKGKRVSEWENETMGERKSNPSYCLLISIHKQNVPVVDY